MIHAATALGTFETACSCPGGTAPSPSARRNLWPGTWPAGGGTPPGGTPRPWPPWGPTAAALPPAPLAGAFPARGACAE